MSNFLTGLNQLDPSIKRHDGGGSSFTLDENGTTQATRLVIGGVEQVPGVDFTVSGTTLSTTSATPSGTNNVVTFQYFKSGTVNTATAVSAGGVNNAAMADDAIGIAELSATGTASSSTFLRGDNAWAAVTNPAISFVSSATASSSSSIEFTGLDNSADCWIVRWTGLHVSAYGNVAIRTSDDASSHSYENGASDYSWVYAGAYPNDTFTSQHHFDQADTLIKCGFDPVYINPGTNDAGNGMCYIWNPSDTTYYKHITGHSYNQYDSGGTSYSSFADFQGVRRSANAVTAVQFFHSLGGTFDAGKFVLYKWLHS